MVYDVVKELKPVNTYDLIIAIESDPYLVNRLSVGQCVSIMTAINPNLADVFERDVEQYDMTPDEALRHAQEGVRSALECRNPYA
jgi:hypothetical protein